MEQIPLRRIPPNVSDPLLTQFYTFLYSIYTPLKHPMWHFINVQCKIVCCSAIQYRGYMSWLMALALPWSSDVMANGQRPFILENS